MEPKNIFTIIVLVISSYFFVLKLLFYRFKKFKCLRCGHCCRLRVKLSKEDIKRLEKVGKKNFIEDKKWLRRINGYCMFLEIKNGRAKCSVYKVRPNICRGWPIKKFMFDTRCRTAKI